MKKLKTNAGITLVALIITIIVLLILAVVSIRAITGGEGIFTKTENATQRYEEERLKEENTVSGYENAIDKYQVNSSNLSIENVLNRAYSYSESDINMIAVYYFFLDDGVIKLKTNGFYKDSKEKIPDDEEHGIGVAIPVTVISEFDSITIYVDEEKVEITPKNAVKFTIGEDTCYILENAIYNRVSNGSQISYNGGLKVLLRDSSLDSILY